MILSLPARLAIIAASSARVVTESFWKTWRRCVFTVCGEMCSRRGRLSVGQTLGHELGDGPFACGETLPALFRPATAAPRALSNAQPAERGGDPCRPCGGTLPSAHLHNDVPTVGQPQIDHLRQIARFEHDLLRLATQPL